MTILQTFVFSIVQGIAELFPVSSVAHGVLVPYIFHWNLSPEFLQTHFLAFVVMLHLGTAVAMFIFFWSDWMKMIRSLFTGKRQILLRVIVATIPAGLIGVVLEHKITSVFSNVTNAAIFLVVNGFFLYFGEKIRTRGKKEIEDLTLWQSLVVGLFQSLALIPGFSRSGSSMTAGFWMGLKHEASARFSMLMATPIIAGASILEAPKILHASRNLLQMSLLGAVLSGIFAFISTWILMNWFKKKEISAMKPFAYYCWALGVVILITRFI